MTTRLSGQIGTFAGYTIAESRFLPVGTVYVNRVDHVVICREAGDFVHKLACEAIKKAMRADLQRTLDEFAARVGVDRSTASE